MTLYNRWNDGRVRRMILILDPADYATVQAEIELRQRQMRPLFDNDSNDDGAHLAAAIRDLAEYRRLHHGPTPARWVPPAGSSWMAGRLALAVALVVAAVYAAAWAAMIRGL